jgi:hypothetical protein
MNAASRKTQLGLVTFGYAAVLALSVFLIVARYLQYLRHPEDVAASGGMYAGGDLLLEIFIVGMLLVVTFFLVLVIYKSEPAFTLYSKALFGLSLTAPLSAGLLSIPALGQGESLLGWACMFRLFASPLLIPAIAISLLFARFPRPKRLIIYAFLVEAFSLIAVVGSIVLSANRHR